MHTLLAVCATATVSWNTSQHALDCARLSISNKLKIAANKSDKILSVMIEQGMPVSEHT